MNKCITREPASSEKSVLQAAIYWYEINILKFRKRLAPMDCMDVLELVDGAGRLRRTKPAFLPSGWFRPNMQQHLAIRLPLHS
ncbi:hypothetical protein BIU88_00675 [Chlorobaculum limnaeum]|uniref:Uncharacterized protein n=1 Tax=Chlorobaculum limnaeum TaxID=274537 RepID=A0A1D8CYA7_CHLLM|nr:hypothetical protein BIU88_00675 [Chlorobaculum limnaeum]